MDAVTGVVQVTTDERGRVRARAADGLAGLGRTSTMKDPSAVSDGTARPAVGRGRTVLQAPPIL
jgi:hypothetical protein